ncbi:MAG: tetratricopeptide repeat protein [Gemmatimonadetes bacterium]|nr:tetratricopeptide repeat protein [Gemmatimonadota bacterium]
MNEETARDPAQARTIRKFNPGTFQADEEVIRQFVVRQPELGIVTDVLRGNIETPACQHVLLVAPRGRGKTMLLARVAAELRADNELSRSMLPVRFMEESHEVFDIADFWLETLFHLSKEIARTDPDLSRELKATHADLAGLWRDEFLAERAKATVMNASDRLGRKLVLMIENMQTLCDDVDSDFGWQLRETLQTEPQIILLGTATKRFERLDDVREPFFELFRILELNPLDTEACQRLWQVISGDDVSERRIRPLQILTGGNPRLLVIVAEFAGHRSLRKLMEELVALVDDHTEYFRGHLEALAPTERRVYLATIDLWRPSSTGEIAARARLDVRSVSSLLGRLIERGVVKVQGTGRKRLYSAAERLYSIYYKIRRERSEAAIVQYLIRFMAVFYTKHELVTMAEGFRSEAAEFPDIKEGLDRVKAEIPHFGYLYDQVVTTVAEPESSNEGFQRPLTTGLSQRQQLLFSLSPKLIKGNLLYHAGKLDDAIPVFASIVEEFGSIRIPDVELLVAMASLSIGHIYDRKGEYDAAIASFDETIEQIGNSKEPRVQIFVASTMLSKSRSEGSLGDLNAALATTEAVVSRHEKTADPHIRKVVAEALLNRGMLKGELGKREEKIASYEEVINRFSDDPEDGMKIVVASAITNIGVAHGQLGDFEAAYKTFDSVIERYGSSESSELQSAVARAMLNKGQAHGHQGESHKAITTFEYLVKRFGDLETSDGLADVVRALNAKAYYQITLEMFDEALCTCDDADRRLLGGNSENSQERTVTSWIRMKALYNKSDEDAALALFQTIYSKFDQDNEDSMGMMQSGVVGMVAEGTSESEILKVLKSNERKVEALAPLVVALGVRSGENVRGPVEVTEVAEDILREIDEESNRSNRT